MLRGRFTALAIVALIAAGGLRSDLLHAQVQARVQMPPPGRQPRAPEPRLTLTWQGQQLAPALERLAESQHTTIWLDRRVDPSTVLDYSGADRSLLEALNDVAAPHEWAAVPFAGVIYFGPKQTADELATLAALAREPLATLPAPNRSRWLQSQEWSAPRLSEPRAVVQELVKVTGAKLQGDELIPHDLWPARKLPATAAIDRLVLLLSGFDLTSELSPDGAGLRIVPIKRPVQITRKYSVSSQRSAAVEALLKEMSATIIERKGLRITVAARVEQHDQIAGAIRGLPQATPQAPPSNSKTAEQRFTLKIENKPVGSVIDQLAKQLKLEVEWDPSAPTETSGARNAPISCDVRDANLDALLRAVLTPAELTFKRDGQKVTIHSAK